jgi:lysophospholipase L1-like esterase
MKNYSPFTVMAFMLGLYLLMTVAMAFVPEKKGWVIAVNDVKKDSLWTKDTVWLKMPGLYDFYNPVFHTTDKKAVSEKVNKMEDKVKKIEEKMKKHKNEFGEELGKPTGDDEVVTGDGVQPLEFGDKGNVVLHSAFKKLSALASNKSTMHIFHYGDSQIEGDRMTSYIRYRLQGKFGGNGPGMIPAYDAYNSMSFKQTRSENWKRYTAFADVSKEVKHKKYGSMVSLTRFTPYYEDSLINEKESVEAFIELSPSKNAYGNAKSYNRVRMYYGNCKSRVDLKVYNNGELIHEDTLNSDGNYHVFELGFKETPNLKFVFNAKMSPDIYSFALEGNYGVQVNNVAMRGSSGTFFGKVDQGLMQRMYNELNADLFIMQFGGNAMPWIESEKEADEVARFFKSQLLTIKKLRPDASIIVIGPSDMSTMVDGVMATYPILPYMVKKMRQASNEAGAAYWDVYAAMGGKNTMAYWVEQGWAVNDYTHFSPQGAKVVSEMFYEAFLLEYQKFINKEK